MPRPTTNSLDQPIHSTAEGIENFWRWFGDSTVVDEQGRPLVCFHGSTNSFSEFDPSKSRFNGGMYFSSSKEFAQKFAGPNGTVYPVYLKIENPYKDGFDGAGVGAALKPSPYRDGGIFTKRQTDSYAEKGTKEYIVFNPEQVKSADQNSGAFDPSAQSALAMAAPTEQHKSLVLYHGTDEEHAKKILQEGFLQGRITQGRAQLAPVAGYVYTSKDVVYAAGYAGAYTHWGSGCRQARKDGTEKFTAYVFVVDASHAHDILVDEDTLGEMGTQRKPNRPLDLPADLHSYLHSVARRVATDNQLTQAEQGFTAYQAAIGKKMQKAIPADMMQKLIDHCPHLALKNKEQRMPIIGYYTLHKSVSSKEEFFAQAEYHDFRPSPAQAVASVLRSFSVPFVTVAAEDIPDYIHVEGTKRPTRNATGRLIYPTLRGIENFWKWFGDSKTVDEHGRPIVYKHGTAITTINEFSGDRGFAGHFTECSVMASDFAKSRAKDAQNNMTAFNLDDLGDAATVYPVYLKCLHLFDAREENHWRSIGVAYDPVLGMAHYEVVENHAQAIKSKYDSAIDFETDEVDTGIAVFSPNQIKSALGNNGNFDPHSNKITASYKALAADDSTIIASVKEQIPGLLSALGYPGMIVPEIEIKHRYDSDYLAQCLYAPDKDMENTKITFMRSVTDNPELLRRILVHELCHHIDFITYWVNIAKESSTKYNRLMKQKDRLGDSCDHGAHGKFWQALAAKANSLWGEGYVQKYSDKATRDQQAEIPAYYVLLKNDLITKRMHMARASKPSTVQKLYLGKLAEMDPDHEVYKLVKSTNPTLGSTAALIGKGFVSFRAGTEFDVLLQDMWKNAEPVSLDVPSEAKGAGFYVLVYREERRDGRVIFRWAQASRPSPAQRSYIARNLLSTPAQCKLFKTTSPDLAKGVSIGKGQGYLPEDRPNGPRVQQELARLWESGTELAADAK